MALTAAEKTTRKTTADSKCPLRMIIVIKNERGQPLSAKIYSRHAHAQNCSAAKKMAEKSRKKPLAKTTSVSMSELSTDFVTLADDLTPSKKPRRAAPLLASQGKIPVAKSNNGCC